MGERQSDGFTTVRIHEKIADEIDKHIASAKDTLGLEKYTSRADFVEQACKQRIEDDRRRAKPVLVG
jgi:metal-responsive CopG/Arc/MetJ family transcriptional regulator